MRPTRNPVAGTPPPPMAHSSEVQARAPTIYPQRGELGAQQPVLDANGA